MSNAARVTGTVLKVETRSGNKDGKDWAMTSARILIANEDICDVGLPDSFRRSNSPLIAGEEVDLFVTIRMGRGGFLNIDAVKPWPMAAVRSLTPVEAASGK